MIIPETIVDFRIYEDGKEFLGVTNATLPDLKAITVSIDGAGIGGRVDVPVFGHYEPMTLGLQFRTVTAAAFNLMELRSHTIDLRSAQQGENPATGEVVYQSIKHVFRVLPISTKGGKVAPASPADVSGEYAVRYWSTSIDGVKTTEIDPFNAICIVNGVDFSATMRAALGK